MPITPEIPIALVIGQDDDDVGRLGGVTDDTGNKSGDQGKNAQAEAEHGGAGLGGADRVKRRPALQVAVNRRTEAST